VLAVAAGCDTTLVHVDHGLRPGSAAEAEVVDGPNLEARARDARYAVLPSDVLTGHTADDQAETVLLHLLRGASLNGLAAMRPGPRRPLLALRRSETHGLCAALGLELVTDPSNLDRRHLRNAVRLDLLPALSEAASRDLVPILTRQADLARDDADLLDSLAAEIDPSDAKAVAAAPPALARRALRSWLTESHPPDAATVERVLAVARGEATATDVGGGRRVERSHQRLRLTGPGSPSADGSANE